MPSKHGVPQNPQVFSTGVVSFPGDPCEVVRDDKGMKCGMDLDGMRCRDFRLSLQILFFITSFLEIG